MKNRILFLFIVGFVPLFSFAQMDDMYFVPQKETHVQEKHLPASQKASVFDEPENVQADETNYSGGETRDVDEYNRRYRWNNDSIVAYSGQDSVDSAQTDSAQAMGGDYQYTRRILRFNAPTIGVAVSSPLYWELRYGPNAIYWDVYDDGFYAYAYPSSWYWGSSFSFYWGWGGPWPWYAGWYDPWYWGPYWHHHHHPHWGYAGHGWYPSRPVRYPSVRHREVSPLARGTASRPGRRGSAVRRSNTGAPRSFTPRTTTNRRQTTRQISTPTNRSGNRNFTPSTRRAYTPSFGGSRSGGSSFTPSRGGGAIPRGGGAMPRGGRR